MGKLEKKYIAPVLIIVVGVGWFLNVQGVNPKIDWIWTSAIAALGVLTLAVGGIDKLTAVIGPFLIISSICSLLRQTGRLPVDKEIPILTIVIGVLLLIAHVLKLKTPEVLKEEKEE